MGPLQRANFVREFIRARATLLADRRRARTGVRRFYVCLRSVMVRGAARRTNIDLQW